MSESSAPIRQALRDALPGAMEARDTPTRNAIRSALAAIENAEAVTVEPRLRELDEDHTLEIVSAERDERLAAAAQHRALGQDDRAAELEAEAAALAAFLC